MIDFKNYWDYLTKDKTQYGEWATILQALQEAKEIIESVDEDYNNYNAGPWLEKYFGEK